MAENIINFFQSIKVNEEQKQAAAGAAGQLQLAIREGQETAPIVQPCQFVFERKIAEFHLHHILLGCTLQSTPKKVANDATFRAVQKCRVGTGTHIPQ
jgi:hypothetical protein